MICLMNEPTRRLWGPRVGGGAPQAGRGPLRRRCVFQQRTGLQGLCRRARRGGEQSVGLTSPTLNTYSDLQVGAKCTPLSWSPGPGFTEWPQGCPAHAGSNSCEPAAHWPRGPHAAPPPVAASEPEHPQTQGGRDMLQRPSGRTPSLPPVFPQWGLQPPEHSSK